MEEGCRGKENKALVLAILGLQCQLYHLLLFGRYFAQCSLQNLLLLVTTPALFIF